jgi:hypothetical protein
MDAIGNVLLSEALGALRESKSQLQRELAQRPEYQALLIVDQATAQLADFLDPVGARPPPQIDGGEADEPFEPRLDVEANEKAAGPPLGQEPPVEANEPAGLPADFAAPLGRSGDLIAEATTPSPAASDETTRATSDAIDRFLSSTAQAATTPASAARPRSYLPFVMGWPSGKSVAAN